MSVVNDEGTRTVDISVLLNARLFIVVKPVSIERSILPTLDPDIKLVGKEVNVVVLGIVIEVMLEQPENTLAPSVERLVQLDKFTDVILTQPWNALAPIVVKPVNPVKESAPADVMPLNALTPIEIRVDVFGRVIVLGNPELANAEMPIDCRFVKLERSNEPTYPEVLVKALLLITVMLGEF